MGVELSKLRWSANFENVEFAEEIKTFCDAVEDAHDVASLLAHALPEQGDRQKCLAALQKLDEVIALFN